MRGKRTNRWDVQVAFPNGAAFGMKSRSDVPQTPETVLREMEDFCTRVRRAIARYDANVKRAAAPAASASAEGIIE